MVEINEIVKTKAKGIYISIISTSKLYSAGVMNWKFWNYSTCVTWTIKQIVSNSGNHVY